jgi:3-methyl-2-oxobutanoate hydroxymethyltransferase
MHDMLGVTQGKLPRFVRNFMEGAPSVQVAFERYVADVKARSFPDDALHGY